MLVILLCSFMEHCMWRGTPIYVFVGVCICICLKLARFQFMFIGFKYLWFTVSVDSALLERLTWVFYILNAMLTCKNKVTNLKSSRVLSVWNMDFGFQQNLQLKSKILYVASSHHFTRYWLKNIVRCAIWYQIWHTSPAFGEVLTNTYSWQ